MPRVSLVMPVRNAARFVEPAVRSVVEQTHGDVELIVMDGGSTDGTLDILHRHRHQIAHLGAGPDRGQADAINQGLARATGDVVGWLNGDDLLMPHAAAAAATVLTAHPRAVGVYGDCACVDQYGAFTRYFTQIEDFSRWRLRNCADFIPQPACFFRRAALLEVGPLDTTLHYALDWDLWCRLSRLGDFRYLPDVLAANREHADTKTSTGGAARLAEVKLIRRRHGTSLLPHALFSYRAQQARADGRRLAHKLWNIAGYCNTLHARETRRAVGGLIHGSHRCLNHLRITFPLFRPTAAVHIHLRTPAGPVTHTLTPTDHRAVNHLLHITTHPTYLDRVSLEL